MRLSTTILNVLARCAKCLHVRSLGRSSHRHGLQGRRRRSERAAISAAVEAYRDPNRNAIICGCVLEPTMLLLDGQPGKGGAGAKMY